MFWGGSAWFPLFIDFYRILSIFCDYRLSIFPLNIDFAPDNNTIKSDNEIDKIRWFIDKLRCVSIFSD